jgi:AAA domain-containing protein
MSRFEELMQQAAEQRFPSYLERLESHFADGDGECPENPLGCRFCLGARNGEGRERSAETEESSWQAVDLAEVLSGLSGTPAPVMFCRSDGPCLVYSGKVHALNAEAESAKTWISLALCAERVQMGESVFYFDFESDARVICERLVALGLETEDIVRAFHYWRPDEPMTDRERVAVFKLAKDVAPSVVVFDGVSEMAGLHGWSIMNNDDMVQLIKTYPRPFAKNGAAVLVLDHLGRDVTARRGHAIGAQHKKAGIDVAYGLTVKRRLGRGLEGRVAIFVWKDRPGHVRPVAAAADLVGEVVITSLEGGNAVSVRVDPPDGTFAGALSVVRPVELMREISQTLERREKEGDPAPNKTLLRRLVDGDNNAIDRAISALEVEGCIRIEQHRNSHIHYFVRPFMV